MAGLALGRCGRRRRGGGFTLIEMLTTVALLIIVLGLMVSLARYVRRRSAEELTRRILVSLHTAMLDYVQQGGAGGQAGTIPNFEPLIDPKDSHAPDEAALQRNALINNREFVQFFRAHKGLPNKAFRDLPLSIYDEATVRDAWGTPIVFMPGMHRQIGMAPGNEWFFFSAGPDRQYLTRDDNQYSYEALGAVERR
jgi:type II secretory pathway pseudopilin PulG